MKPFSISEINVYTANPFKHFISYVMGVWPESSAAAERGTSVHSLLEEIGNRFKEDSLEVFKEITKDMDTSSEDYVTVNRYLSYYTHPETSIFKSYHQLPWASDCVKVETELKLEVPMGDYTFKGFIDLVVHHEDGSVSLYDYKTLSNKPSRISYEMGYQGNMYMLAMQKLGYTVREFIFDCMNPKLKIAWNGYHFERIHLYPEENKLFIIEKSFRDTVKEITTHPKYRYSGDGWYDPVHLEGWRAFCMGTEIFKSFLNDHSVDYEKAVSAAINKGYAIPFILGEQVKDLVPLTRITELDKEEYEHKVEKVEISWRGSPDNLPFDKIVATSADYVYATCSKGAMVFTQEGTKVPNLVEKWAELSEEPDGMYQCKI